MAEDRPKSENAAEAAIGFAVLLAAGLFLYYLLGGGQSFDDSETYEISALFNSAEGIAVGSDVRMAGIKIGNVAAMGLDMDTYKAKVDLSIKNGIGIPDDSFVAISPVSLLGGYFMEITPGGSFLDVEPGGTLSNTQGYVSLITVISRAFSSD